MLHSFYYTLILHKADASLKGQLGFNIIANWILMGELESVILTSTKSGAIVYITLKPVN